MSTTSIVILTVLTLIIALALYLRWEKKQINLKKQANRNKMNQEKLEWEKKSVGYLKIQLKLMDKLVEQANGPATEGKFDPEVLKKLTTTKKLIQRNVTEVEKKIRDLEEQTKNR